MESSFESILQLSESLICEPADKSTIDASVHDICANLNENEIYNLAINYNHSRRLVHGQLFLALIELSIAKSSNPDAIYSMALIYHNGISDLPQSITDHHQSNPHNRNNAYSDGQHPSSTHCRYRTGVRQDAPRAVGLYRRAIDRHNHVSSIFSLAFLYQHGAPGVAQDASAAVKLYRRAFHVHVDVK